MINSCPLNAVKLVNILGDDEFLAYDEITSLRELGNANYYWVLPPRHNGNWLLSYGANLFYTMNFRYVANLFYTMNFRYIANFFYTMNFRYIANLFYTMN